MSKDISTISSNIIIDEKQVVHDSLQLFNFEELCKRGQFDSISDEIKYNLMYPVAFHIFHLKEKMTTRQLLKAQINHGLIPASLRNLLLFASSKSSFKWLEIVALGTQWDIPIPSESWFSCATILNFPNKRSLNTTIINKNYMWHPNREVFIAIRK